jgi:hypothetical protein
MKDKKLKKKVKHVEAELKSHEKKDMKMEKSMKKGCK